VDHHIIITDRIEMILFIGCPKIVEGMIGPIEILLANDTYDFNAINYSNEVVYFKFNFPSACRCLL
jgi:hypothetical protein